MRFGRLRTVQPAYGPQQTALQDHLAGLPRATLPALARPQACLPLPRWLARRLSPPFAQVPSNRSGPSLPLFSGASCGNRRSSSSVTGFVLGLPPRLPLTPFGNGFRFSTRPATVFSTVLSESYPART